MASDELEQARLGFNQYLRRKGFSRQFIDRNGDELFATAALEYSRKLAEGEEIESPAAWLVSCASQRTIDQLRVEARRPAAVSAEKCPVVDEADGPEDVLLDKDRFRKVRDAVKELPIRQRRLLALSYFEGLTVREAARQLHWHSSKAQRAHEGAKRRLHDLLGVSSSDKLEVEIGLAAYLSLAAGGASGNLLERAAQRSAETLASFKQQVGEAGAQLKEHASATYYRAIDPTPLAAARPGTVAAVIASCVAIGGGAATYCAEQGMDPLGAASGLIASTDEPETPPTEAPDSEPEAPTYTPAEPTPSETPSQPEATGVPEAPSKPEKASPVSDNYEPVHTDYMDESEEEPTETYEEPNEPAPVESFSQPAAVASGAGPQFGGPGGR
jgi:RNA polymerase sigma factor (sigma-70 family)